MRLNGNVPNLNEKVFTARQIYQTLESIARVMDGCVGVDIEDRVRLQTCDKLRNVVADLLLALEEQGYPTGLSRPATLGGEQIFYSDKIIRLFRDNQFDDAIHAIQLILTADEE